MTALDKDSIKAALESRIEDLVRYLLLAGHREGRQWVVGDVDNNAGITGPAIAVVIARDQKEMSRGQR